MKGKQFIGIIGIVLATQFTVFAQSHLKIGYTNVDYVLSQMPEAKQIESELKSFNTQLENQLKAKVQDAQRKYEELQKSGSTMNEIVRNDKIKELENLQASIQEFERSAAASSEQKKASLLQPALDKIQKAIDAVAKEDAFNFVFSTNTADGSPILLYAGENENISSKVLKKLGITPTAPNTSTAPKTTTPKTK